MQGLRLPNQGVGQLGHRLQPQAEQGPRPHLWPLSPHLSQPQPGVQHLGSPRGGSCRTGDLGLKSRDSLRLTLPRAGKAQCCRQEIHPKADQKQ